MEDQQQANLTEIDTEPVNSLFLASNEHLKQDERLWIVDSCCTNHMCKDEKLFNNLI